MSDELVATRWDAEYRAGRYVAERPLPFAGRVLSTLRAHFAAMTGVGLYFYSREELLELARDRFRLLAEPREDVTARTPPKTGSWAQWEAVWQKL